MKQAWARLRLGAFVLCIGLWGCQQKTPLAGANGPGDKKGEKSDQDKDKQAAEAEQVTPPTNIIGSYLVCREDQQLVSMDQNASVSCGVFVEPGHVPRPVQSLSQWQLQATNAVLQSLTPGSADQVQVRFQATTISELKLAVQKAKLTVRTDSGESFAGLVGDLLPVDSRLSPANTNKIPAFAGVWNEGFEGTRINAENALYYDLKAFSTSVNVNWANSIVQTTACGAPVLEVMQYATQGGSSDTIGAAEGLQFLDTDSACWPDDLAQPIRGPSNLTIGKDLSLLAGRVYRIIFKIRQQPLPPGFAPVVQNLQLRINQTVVKEFGNLSNAAWQEISFDFVAGSGVTRLEWFDAGASDDSIGVLLDDLRLQLGNF